MSTLHHDEIFDSCNNTWDIRPCLNGVGNWEVFDDTGSVHETFDTLDAARRSREELVLQTWEDMLQ